MRQSALFGLVIITLVFALGCQSTEPAPEAAPEKQAATVEGAPAEQPAAAAEQHPCPYKQGLADKAGAEPECPMAKAARGAGEPECPFAKQRAAEEAAAGECAQQAPGAPEVCECPPDKPDCKCGKCPDDCECKGGDKPCTKGCSGKAAGKCDCEDCPADCECKGGDKPCKGDCKGCKGDCPGKAAGKCGCKDCPDDCECKGGDKPCKAGCKGDGNCDCKGQGGCQGRAADAPAAE